MLDEQSLQLINRKGSLDLHSQGQEGNDDANYFGMSKSFFQEIFIPKESTFKNNMFDLTVEDTRFLSYPYFFEEVNIKKGKGKKKTGQET